MRPVKRIMKQSSTIYDIAKACQVSPRTVSRFLNDPGRVAPATRERLRTAVEALRFRPNVYATRVSRGSRDVSAVMVYFGQSNRLSDLHQTLLAHISCELCRAGKDLLLIGVNTENQERAIREHVLPLKFDALLMLTPVPEPMLAAIASSPFATITINWEPVRRLPRNTYVGIDYQRSSFDYTRALLAKGYRNICYLHPGLPGGHRERGMLEAVRAHGPRAQAVSVPLPGQRPCLDEVREAVGRVLKRRPGTDLIYGYSDEIAVCALHALRQAGLDVPRHVGVAGFDGAEMARQCIPRLTTMSQPWFEMARHGAELLATNPRTRRRRISLEATLAWGDSTAP